jgi:acyl carrier protein
MNESNIVSRLKTIVADGLSVDLDMVTVDSNFVKDLGADSIDVLTIVIFVEDEFNIEIPDQDAERMKTVRDVIEYLKKKVLIIY